MRASTSVDATFSSILHEKTYFFLFYIFIFTKHPHQFIYSTHLFNKIFIFLQFFIIPSLTAPLSYRPTVHHYQRSLHTQPPSSPPNQYHQGNQPTQSETHSIPNPFITHPIGSKIIKTHQWTQKKNNSIKVKTHRPTPIINQKTRKKKKKKKKKTATNKSKWDRHLRTEQDRCLTAPPPPCDGRHHALHPRFRVLPPHPVCSWRDLTWSKLIFLWEFMDTRRNEIRKEEY